MIGINYNNVDFHGWKKIDCQGVNIASYFGKNFFHYDKNNKKLYFENLNVVELIFHYIFGYKDYLNRENLWEYLESKKIVVGDCPKKEDFRKLVEENLFRIQKNKALYFTSSSKHPSEDDLIRMFETGLDVNCHSSTNGKTALLHACLEKQYTVAKHLIENGANVNAGWGNGRFVSTSTPFRSLLGEFNPELALLLINRDLDADAEGIYRDENPLHSAIRLYDPVRRDTKKIIKALLEKKPKLEAIDHHGWTPLCHACQTGDLEIIKWLVERGAKINVGKLHETPLNLTVQTGKIENVEYLLKQGALIPNVSDKSSPVEKVSSPLVTVLLHSQNKPSKDLIELLIEEGVDVNHQLPLFYAVVRGYEDIVKLLIKSGANVNAVTQQNKTALNSLFSSSLSQEKKIKVAKLLLELGADPNIVQVDDVPPLFNAAYIGSYDLVNLLLNSGAKINAIGKDNKTALSCVLESILLQIRIEMSGRAGIVQASSLLKIAKLLLDSGANPNISKVYGRPLLCIAVMHEIIDFVKLLLEYQITDVNIKDVIIKECDNTEISVVNSDVPKRKIKPRKKKSNKLDALSFNSGVSSSKGGHISYPSFSGTLDLDFEDDLFHNATPLHIAVAVVSKDIVNELIGRADVTCKDKIGRTPLDIAKENKNNSVPCKEIYQLLSNVE